MSTTFAEKLKAWRASKGMLGSEAAEFLKVPVRTYEEWEQGRMAPTVTDALLKLLEIGIVPPRRRRANQRKRGGR